MRITTTSAPSSNTDLIIIIAVVLGALVLVVLFIVIVCILRRKKHFQKCEKEENDYDAKDVISTKTPHFSNGQPPLTVCDANMVSSV